MKTSFLFAALCSILVLSCGDDDMNIINAPSSYTFERDGFSTVAFAGQTTRIQMATELTNAMIDFNSSEAELLEMYRNQTTDGGDASPFNNADLNASTKSIKSKVAASADYFSANTVEGQEIKTNFEQWIGAQVNDVFPNQNELAGAGIPGQIADGTSVRYVDGKGLEYNQAASKALIGALMLDQIVNNYLSPAVLDAGEQRVKNDNGTTEGGQNYTTMEHKWDEAYGYLFGSASNAANPIATLGSDDNFLNKYLGRVNEDNDFTGIAEDIYDAFKLGRAAIVARDYDLRDEQAEIIREKLSQVIAIRAVFYLQQGKNALPPSGSDFGSAFHDLSEGFGFIYSLRFTRMPRSSAPYFSKSEADEFLADLMTGNGFWEVTPEMLDSISEAIAAKFDFTVMQAGR